MKIDKPIVNKISFNESKSFGSCYFKGNDDYLKYSYIMCDDSSDWDIAGNSTDNWTIDFWFKLIRNETTGFIAQSEGTGINGLNDYWRIAYTKNYGFRFVVNDAGSNIVNTGFGGPAQIPLHRWYHLVLIKVANKYALYLDGAQINYTESTSTKTFSAPLKIAQDGNDYSFVSGYIDELRIIHENVYSANPNSALTDIITISKNKLTSNSNTKLLLHFDNNELIDNSDNHHTIYNINAVLTDTEFIVTDNDIETNDIFLNNKNICFNEINGGYSISKGKIKINFESINSINYPNNSIGAYVPIDKLKKYIIFEKETIYKVSFSAIIKNLIGDKYYIKLFIDDQEINITERIVNMDDNEIGVFDFVYYINQWESFAEPSIRHKVEIRLKCDNNASAILENIVFSIQETQIG